MDKLKTILTWVGVILGALAVLAMIGLIYNFLGLILLLGAVCLAGYIAIRWLGRSDPKQITGPDPNKELRNVQRILDEYKRK